MTESQLADVLAQEMHRNPGTDLDLRQLWQHRRWRLGPGRYETLHVVGERRDVPMVTFTASWIGDAVPYNPPSLNYLRMMASGLVESHDLDLESLADYLISRPGVRPAWTRDDVVAAIW